MLDAPLAVSDNKHLLRLLSLQGEAEDLVGADTCSKRELGSCLSMIKYRHAIQIGQLLTLVHQGDFDRDWVRELVDDGAAWNDQDTLLDAEVNLDLSDNKKWPGHK